MPLKNLLVFTDGGDATEARLDTAIALAERWAGHVTCVAATAHPSFNLVYESVPASQEYFKEVQEAHAEAAGLARRAQAYLVSKGRKGDTRWASDTLGGMPEIAAIHGYYADLPIVGQPGTGDFAALRNAIFDGVLYDSGRPALMIPEGWGGKPVGTKVVAAWSPSREASRAVHDALPFIAAAGGVSVAVVDPNVGDRTYGEEPGADIATALARWEVAVTVDRLPGAGQNVAEALLHHADAISADLIVMGGYGHSRLREALIGGVTRDMIATATVPVFFSR